MKPYLSCLLACLRFVPVVLAVALSAVASAASGWVDISGNLPAGIDRGQTRLVAVHFINDTEGWVCDANLKAVYHTTDGGASWSTIAVPGASDGRAPTAIFMKSATEGWIGCDDGRLYHTSDGWTTWTGIYSTGERIYDIDCGPGATAAIAVGDKGACFALTDTGATRLSGPSITLPTDNEFMSVSAPTAGEAWIGTSGASVSTAYLYHSVDGVLQTDQAGYHDSGILGVFMWTNKVGHMLTGQFNPRTNTWLDSGINSTVDGVNWWVNTNVPSTHVIKIDAYGRSMQSTIVFSDVALVSADEGWIVGSDGWILHTTNATETATRCANGWAEHGSYSAEDAAATVWTREGEGLTELAFNRVFFPSANAGYAIGPGDMLGTSNLHHRAALFKRTALLGPATITFAVTEGSAPVPGATITFNGVSAQTDAAGHATVVLPAASVPIEHRYTVEAAGLRSEARYLALGAGATAKTEAIEMRPIPGEFVRLATEAPGVRTGFSRPQDVHVDASGNLWVLDLSASSVQQYNTAGALVSEWSLGIDNVYARRAVQEFERDASGNWYVLVRPYRDSDTFLQCPGEVRKYDSTGNLLATWTGTPQTGSFGGIRALALDHSGNVYLGTGKRGILKLDSSGNLLDRFGCGVTLDANGNEVDGDGQMPLAWVMSLAVDSTGRIYAGEASGEDAITRVAGQSSYSYIAVYSAAGRFVARWGGSPDAAGALFRGAVQSLVCDASDRVVAIDPKANRVQTFSSTGTVVNAWGTYGVDDGKLDGPCRLGRDPGGNLYLVEGTAAGGYSGAAAKSRIQKFTATGTWQRTWTGTTATVDGSFDTPWGVGVAPTGEVYVTDYDRNRVQKFAADGTFLLGFGTSGSGDGQFNHPTGVAVDASGNLYVGDRFNDRVQVFSSNGTFLRKFGASGTSGLGNFCDVNSVAIGPDGNVYVGDQRSLQKCSPDGTALARWGSYGSGTGQFYSINGIGFDAAGNIYTTEWYNHRVQVFDSAGNFLRTWGRRGEDDGEFVYGFGLAFDAAGYLYVSDNARVQGFTTDGDFVTRFGPNDGGAGEFGRPHGLARSPTTGALYLADTRTKALYRCPAPVIAHRVSFSVTDRGQALAGATVAINGVSVVTDSTGVVSLWLPTGSYPYTVTRADYASGSGTLTVGATSAVEAVSLLRLSGISLVVKVTDPRSQPLANVKVVLDGTTLRYTDSLGTAIIGGSGRGVHTYVASTPGFETASASFEQTSSGFVLTIVLQSSRTVLTAPTTTTGGVNAVSVSAANLSGEVTADGGASITARGVVCSLSANPTLDTGTAFISGVIWNNGVVTDLGTGAFTATAIGLSAGTTYHYRAYATNSAGTSYGADATFTTEPAVSGYGWTQQAAKLVAAGATSGSFFLRDIDHVTVDGTTRLFLTSGGTSAGSIVYRSDDGGTTFVATGAAADTFEALSVRPDGQTLFGAGYGKVWKSTDGGTSWTKSTLMGSGYFSDVHFVTDTVGYAVGGSGAGGVPYVHGFRTTDGGATWTEMTNRASPHDRGYYDAVWAPDATHPDTVWVAQGTGITYILHSTDGGTTWGESDTMDEVTDLYFKDANTGWGAGGIGRNCGIYRYVKGYWVKATTPSHVAEESLNALAFAPDGLNGWAVGNEGIILHSTDGGATWEREGQSLDLPNRGFPGHRETLCGVTVVSAHEAYVVGNDGSLLKFGVLGSTETMPTVTTGAISAVAATSATAAGNVTADGGAGVTARGVVYGLLGNPTLATGTAVAAGSEMGGFTAAITGLSPSTTYHLRAYATNAAGTSYGDDVSFTTEAADTSAPAAPTITTGAGSTTDRTPTLGGVAEAGSTVTLYVDGVACGTTVAGGDGSWAFTLPAAVADGNHSISATATDAAGNTSAASGGSRLTVVATSFAAPVPDGYGAGATGGAAGTAVVAGTAEEFVTYAASSDAHVITVVGSLDIGTAAMASNKTIQGADASATLDGCLSLTNVSNIVIRGLNLANPDGTALRLSGASKVYVTRCSFLDAAAPQLVATGSDQLTVSWCEFAATVAGQSAVQLGASGETTTPRITLHHNWWSTNLASALPSAASGQVHQYSNYVAVTGNTTGTAVSGTAQLFSEGNVYSGTANPLAKSGAARIRALDNVYTTCTGTTDTGADTVFTPSYGYTLLDRGDLATLLPVQAGNVSGAGYTEETVPVASISATATTVAPGASATLTAGLTGAPASAYQWRLNNAPLAGATGSTYTISSMAAANAGTYTVAVSLANGDTVVGTPATIALGTAPTPPPTPTPTPDSNKGGGGGACGSLFALALGLFATLRRRSWHRS